MSDIFSIAVKPKRKEVYKTYRRAINGRTFIIERRASHEWEGWYDDDHAVTYVGKTMGSVLADAMSDIPTKTDLT